MPPVFPWLQKLGDIEEAEMYRVFNMGIGFVMIVGQYYAESVLRQLRTVDAESTNLPLLDHVAQKRRPILLSTGMADMAETPSDGLAYPAAVQASTSVRPRSSPTRGGVSVWRGPR